MELAQVKRIAAAVRSADSLRRISGGSETDVYCSDAGHVVLKIKPLAATSLQAAHAEIEAMQETATTFATYLSATHSIQTEFMLSQDEEGTFYAIAIQPFLAAAQPLATVDYRALHPCQRTKVQWQLLFLLRQSLRCYHETGHMPDLYGTFSQSVVERQRMNSPLMWPRRVARFFTQRLWLAYNLLLATGEQPRVVLVDYDQVRWRGLWGQLYYAICYLLFWRDLLWLVGRNKESLPQMSVTVAHYRRRRSRLQFCG